MSTPAGKGGGRNGGAKGGRLTVLDHPIAPSPPLSIAELSRVREVYWSLARQGHRLPAQRGVILIDDGANTFAGCGGADVLAELARRDLLPARNGVAPATSTRPRPSPRPVEPHAPSLEIWREAVPATDDTLTARYLRGRRLGGTDRWIGFRSYDTLYLIHSPPPEINDGDLHRHSRLVAGAFRQWAITS